MSEQVFHRRIVTLFSIALTMMMALSAVPVALAAGPADSVNDDGLICDECNEHAHDGCCDHDCKCNHLHDCDCCHCHECVEAHDCGGPGTELASGLTTEPRASPRPPETSGFPVWLDQSQTVQSGGSAFGLQPDMPCTNPDCVGGLVQCSACGGTGQVGCPICGGDGWEDCLTCGGDGWEECLTCSGFGTVDCWSCSGTGDCAVCGGTGDVGGTPCGACGATGFCPVCGGTGDEMCASCSGAGGWTCTLCGGMGGWDCMTCNTTGSVSCSNCGGDGNLGTCPTCGGDTLMDYDNMLAQEFVPSATAQLEMVRLEVNNPNSYTSNMHVFITDNDTQISNEMAVPGTEVGTSPQWIDVYFDTSVLLTAGQTYYIVTRADEYDWGWTRSSANPYAAGQAWYTTNDAIWTAMPSVDRTFQTYMTTNHTKIYTIQDLQDVKWNLTGNYALMNDIDATETAGWNGGSGFEPVGDNNSFVGQFEGNGHIISNLYINRPSQQEVGLFATIDTGARVNDTHLANANITGLDYVGALVGHGYGISSVGNCSVTGHVVGQSLIGGLVGADEHSQFSVHRSYSAADVSGNTWVGSFMGYNIGSIVDCYSTGGSYGTMFVGSFVGGNEGGDINRCFSSGPTNGYGFAGSNGGGTIGNSFWDTETTGAAMDLGANDRTTAQMMTQANFEPTGWDFSNVWWMVNGQTRPFLRIEYSTEITDSHQLQMMQMDLTADYTLENDIDLSDIAEPSQMWGTSVGSGGGFWPVGDWTVKFLGNFDGQGHAVSGLYIDRPTLNYVGLFGCNGDSTEIKNITLDGADVNGQSYVGILSGLNQGEVDSCYVWGESAGTDVVGGILGSNLNSPGIGILRNSMSWVTVTAGNEMAGGLIGFCWGSVYDSVNHGLVTAGRYAGGIAGRAQTGEIVRCASDGNVTATNLEAGGLIGTSSLTIKNCSATGHVVSNSFFAAGLVGYNMGTIENSYARGSATGSSEVGGLIGRNQFLAGQYIKNCYSVGTVTGTGFQGGFIGYDLGTPAPVSDCFWDTQTSGQAASYGGTPKTTAEMMQQATFTNWNFTNIWGIVENLEYPVLRAQQQSDLEISLAFNSTYATVGSRYQVAMTMTNHGPDTAFNAVVSILLPPQMSLAGWTNSPVIEGNYVNYTFGAMMNGWQTLQMIEMDANTYAPTVQIFGVAASESGDPGNFPNEEILIVPMNQGPNAVNDSYVTDEDVVFNVAAPGVLANDTDPDGDGLQVVSHWNPSAWGATLAVAANGSFTYDPRNSPAIISLKPGDTLFDYFEYTVSDGKGGTDTAQVTVVVNGANDAPSITTTDTLTATVNVNYTYDYNADDPDDGDVLTWAVATNAAAWLSINATTGVLSGTPTATGTFWVNISVSDTFLASDWSNFTLTVTHPNRPPVITTANVLSAYVGTLYSEDYDATDADGDTLTWSLNTDATWLGINTATGVLSGTPLLAHVGTFSVNVSVSDGNGGSDYTEFTLTVVNNNHAPVITTTDILTATVGTQYSVDYSATDADSDVLAWSLQTNATWLGIVGTTGVLSGTPTAAGTFWVNVSVNDGMGGLDYTYFTVTVHAAPPANHAPVITTTTLPDGTIGQSFEFKVIATDSDGDSLTWSLETNATWLSINGTGYLSGTPTATGAVWALVTVSDGNGGTDYTNFTLTVIAGTALTDTDSDGVPDTMDAFPTDPAASVDADDDGLPDAWNPGYTAEDSTTGLELDDDPLVPADDDRSNTWMLIIIILVIVCIAGAVWWFRPKVPKTEKFDPQPAESDEEPPNFDTNPSDANKVEPKENIAEEGAVTYVESQTPYDRLG